MPLSWSLGQNPPTVRSTQGAGGAWCIPPGESHKKHNLCENYEWGRDVYVKISQWDKLQPQAKITKWMGHSGQSDGQCWWSFSILNWGFGFIQRLSLYLDEITWGHVIGCVWYNVTDQYQIASQICLIEGWERSNTEKILSFKCWALRWAKYKLITLAYSSLQMYPTYSLFRCCVQEWNTNEN